MKKTFRSILVLALITAMMACLIVPVSAEEEILFEEPMQEEFFEFEEEPVEEEFVEEEPIEEEPVEEEPVEEEFVEEEPVVEEPTEEPVVEEPTEEPAVEEPTEEPSAEPTEEPTEEPSAEPTEEPTEAPAEEPTEEPAEQPEEEESVEFEAELEVLLMNDEDVELFFGDEVTLQAVVYFANLDYVIRWEANANIDDVEEWFTVDETNTPFYTFELTEENALWEYRATLVALEEDAEA